MFRPTTKTAAPPASTTAAQPLGVTYAIEELDQTAPMRGPYMILKGFAAKGWDVDVLTPLSTTSRQLDRLWDLVPVRKVGNGTQSDGRLRMHQALLRPRPSRITLTWIWPYQRYSLAAARQLWGNPYALVLDSYTHAAPWNRETPFDRLKQAVRYGMVLRNAAVILAETPFIRDLTKQHFPQADVLYAPVCVWLRDLQQLERTWEQAGLTPARKQAILFAGQIVPRKGVHDLLAAFASLAAEFRGWNVEIIGPDDDQAYMQQLALLVEKHGLQHRVNFLPMLSGEALYRRYRASSIYCFPTCHEGVPMTIVEAMCYGGAIVAGNAGFISHQLDDGNAGMLFKPGDVAALAGCLRQLMASEDLRNGYMARARQRVVNTFVWERYFESIEAACARHITRLV